MQQITTCCTENTPCLALGSHPVLGPLLKVQKYREAPLKCHSGGFKIDFLFSMWVGVGEELNR